MVDTDDHETGTETGDPSEDRTELDPESTAAGDAESDLFDETSAGAEDSLGEEMEPDIPPELDPSGETDESDSNPTTGETDESGSGTIDPDVLEADEVATGQKEVEDVLNAETEPESPEQVHTVEDRDGAESGRSVGDSAIPTEGPENGTAKRSDRSLDGQNQQRSSPPQDSDEGDPEPDAREESTSGTDQEVQSQGGADQEQESDPRREASADRGTEGSTPDGEHTGVETGSDDSGHTDSSLGSGEDENADANQTGTPARTTISALEYNKVMRLLQNREFPVERAEIIEVAASAYDLAEADCEEVIDLAIDRGLLEETEGQLVRPE
jgi:hypothetical protein